MSKNYSKTQYKNQKFIHKKFILITLTYNTSRKRWDDMKKQDASRPKKDNSVFNKVTQR